MQEIIIDGVNLTELKAKRDAIWKEQQEVNKLIQQGSAKFISEHIQAALVAVEGFKKAETKEVAESEAAIALANLEAANFVSEISGVSYDLPYTDSEDSIGGVDEEDTISCIVLSSEFYDYDTCDGLIGRLADLASEMESEVTEWNSSYC